jgi:hypothetical protein
MAADAAAEGKVKEGILSKVLPAAGAGVEGAGTAGVAADGSVIKGSAGGGRLSDREVAGAGPKVGKSWAEARVNGEMRIRLSKMRKRGDICIYYLFYISERNETRFNRRR